jgi:hypothetical protein
VAEDYTTQRLQDRASEVTGFLYVSKVSDSLLLCDTGI